MIPRSIFLLLLLSLGCFAGEWTNFTVSNSGLASNSVRCIVIDDNGNKWFGTDK